MQILHDYVKNIGNQFVYSQQAIDLVQQYIDKFPRVFEILNASNQNDTTISEFDANNNETNGLKYLGEVRKWLQELPYWKKQRRTNDLMQLSYASRKHILQAVDKSVSRAFFSLFQKLNIPFYLL